jgi:predicted permease
MAPYIPAIIWLIGIIICGYIAKKRHVKQTFIWKFIVILLGPLAIPLMFFAKRDKTIQTN